MTNPDLELRGAVVALGTLHRKADQIAPALQPLGVTVITEAIDTDRFGTFDGRIPRTLSPSEAAESKARAAARAAGVRFGLGSEGSFSLDPDVPWCTTQLELVTFVDLGTDLVVTGRSRRAAPWATPGTDLRAHRCEPRRATITAAAADLADRLGRRCPSCAAPGVGHLRSETGRPCAWCGGPTFEVAQRVDACPGCGDEWVHRTDGHADPAACPACNP